MSLGRLNTTSSYVGTVAQAGELLSNLESELLKSTGESSLINAVIAKLQLTINRLKQEEAKLLEMFGVKDEAALQKKFNDFYARSGLVNLSGSQIRKIFLDEYQISLDKNMKEMQTFLDKMLPGLIKSIQEAGKEVTIESVKKAFNQWLKATLIELDLTSGKVVVTRSGELIDINENEQIRLLANKLTSEQKRRLNSFLEYGKKHGNPQITGGVQIYGNSVDISFKSEWFELTQQGMSANQIKTALKNKKITQEQFEIIQDKITNLICSQVKNPGLVKSYIKEMLDKDPYIFFVGQNVNDITGILGEISAVVAISELMPNVNASKILNWVANEKKDTKKLSIDILLKDLGNIQVKNTSLDTNSIPELDISFAQGNINTILGKLGGGYGWDSDLLSSVLESESFNVPAKFYGGSFHETGVGTAFRKNSPEDWNIFVEAYGKMQSIISKAHIFLTSYAPDFLYMASPPSFENQLAVLDYSLDGFVGQGIHIYLVAGVPHLASTQLTVIQEDLKKLLELKQISSHFNIKTSFGSIGEEKLPYNYVSYKNSNGGIRKAKLTSSMSFPV